MIVRQERKMNDLQRDEAAITHTRAINRRCFGKLPLHRLFVAALIPRHVFSLIMYRATFASVCWKAAILIARLTRESQFKSQTPIHSTFRAV